jgi:hypothetical protein
LERAQASIEHIRAAAASAPGQLSAGETQSHEQLANAIGDAQLIVAAGAPGFELLPAAVLQQANQLRVAIDLNAVAPLGIESIEVTDCAIERGGVICYGAIGVGGLKMTIHRTAIEKLFTANDLVLDAEEIFALGRELQNQKSS